MKIHDIGFDAAVNEVQKHLCFLKAVGFSGVELSPKSLDTLRSWEAGSAGAFSPASPQSLSAVFDDYLKCRRCGLAGKEQGSVFGAGAYNARLMFIGFTPEEDDGKSGEPYSGKQGALLTRIITAMGLDRNSVYICPAVKCLPRDGRSPNKYEAKVCRYHLVRQIQAIRPAVICLLGDAASQALLGVDVPIGRIRGQFNDYKGTAAMPTYDPAQVLSDPSLKRPVWEDIQKIMERLASSR